VFGVRLGGSPRPIPLKRGLLHAVEINPQRAFAAWLRRRTAALETIVIRGTWLDQSDVHSLLTLTLPGIDEVASLLELLRYGTSGEYDLLVIDTAPTGHTLRMLSMPEMLAGLARVFDHMQARHRAIVEALRRGPVEDEADAVIRALQGDARALWDLLRDPGRTEVSLVTLPEILSVDETLDSARHLQAEGIPLARVIVNRITPVPPDSCGWCEARRRAERQAMASLAAGLRQVSKAAPPITTIDAHEDEPIGVSALKRLAADLERGTVLRAAAPRVRARMTTRVAGLPAWSVCEPFDASIKLLMFGGKGGVGKTTCAAAAALDLAATHGNRRVLLVSTDPAHSLSDVLDLSLSDEATGIPGGPGNLEALELDAARALDPLRHEYASSIDALFDRLARGSAFDASHDRQVMHDLVDLSPPGLDEIAAVLRVIDLLGVSDGAHQYDIVVVDTAPTGHALRLLETPATVHEWTKALMSIVLKYQPVMGVGELGAALLRLSRSLTRFRTLLANSRETQFVIVSGLAAVPRAETLRLQASLRRLRLRVPAVVVNAVGAGECRRCRRGRRREERALAAFARSVRRASRTLQIVVTPATVPPPIGRPALENWRRRWRCPSH
jgi:arsenite-transporting ATPase